MRSQIINMIIAVNIAILSEIAGITLGVVRLISATEVGFAEAISTGDIITVLALTMIVPTVIVFSVFVKNSDVLFRVIK
jgi:hypothetical protein